jgi:hypothetical protein
VSCRGISPVRFFLESFLSIDIINCKLLKERRITFLLIGPGKNQNYIVIYSVHYTSIFQAHVNVSNKYNSARCSTYFNGTCRIQV